MDKASELGNTGNAKTSDEEGSGCDSSDKASVSGSDEDTDRLADLYDECQSTKVLHDEAKERLKSAFQQGDILQAIEATAEVARYKGDYNSKLGEVHKLEDSLGYPKTNNQIVGESSKGESSKDESSEEDLSDKSDSSKVSPPNKKNTGFVQQSSKK